MNLTRKSRLLVIAFALVIIIALVLSSCTGTQTVPRGWAGPALSDGNIYVASMGGKLVALNATTHERLYQDVPFTTRQAGGLGCGPTTIAVAIYGTPAVTAELVYISGYNGKLYANNVKTGASRWVYPREGEMKPIVGGATVALGKVFFGSADGKLYALDAATGDFQWEFKTGDKIWSTPTVAGDTVYIGSFDKKLYAIDASRGTEKWRFETPGAIAASALVADGVVYIGSFDRYLYALNANDGSLKWKFMASNWFWAKPLADKGFVYAPSLDGKVYAFKAGSGEKVTEFDLGSPVISSPVLVGGVVIAATEKGELYSLDAGANQKNLIVKLDENINSPLAASADGVIYVYSVKDNLFAVEARSGAILWNLPLKS